MADRIAVMRDGNVVQFASPQEVYHDPVDLFTARLFSRMTGVAGKAQESSVATPLGRFPARGLDDGERVILAV